jgi:serpin B
MILLISNLDKPREASRSIRLDYWLRNSVCGTLTAMLIFGLGCRGKRLAVTESSRTASVIDSNNGFALDLYRRLGARDGNLAFSPISIYTAAGMACAGARGQTQSEIAKALHFSLPQQDIHLAFHELLDGFNTIPQQNGLNLTVTESLWLRAGCCLKETFLELIRSNYDAEAYSLDFGNKTLAANRINAWVEQRTAGRIKDFVNADQIEQNTRLLLCSAMYFKGKWQTQFDGEDTRPGPFYISPTQTVVVPMMSEFAELKTAIDDSVQILEIPYSGGRISMIIIVRPAPGDLLALEQELTVANLHSWVTSLEQCEPCKTAVSLPRFALKQSFDLVNDLKSLGVSSAFSANADFSGMDGTTNLFIEDAIHKAVIVVNETGTQASAVTRVHTSQKSMPATFRADSPFIFLIRDNHTGCILFMGRVVNPLND